MLTHPATLSFHVRQYRSDVQDKLQLTGVRTGLFGSGSKQKTFAADEEIFGEGERVDYIYKVVRGVVRSYKSMRNGRRKIEAFRWPGDVFGFDTSEQHRFGAEGVGNVCVLMAQRTKFSRQDCELDGERWVLIASELQRVQKHALLLAKNSRERLASFLLEVSQQLDDIDTLTLPMSRQDIADYLGLTIETVSRKLTEFQAKRLIRRPASQQITILDRVALRRIAGVDYICPDGGRPKALHSHMI